MTEFQRHMMCYKTRGYIPLIFDRQPQTPCALVSPLGFPTGKVRDHFNYLNTRSPSRRKEVAGKTPGTEQELKKYVFD